MTEDNKVIDFKAVDAKLKAGVKPMRGRVAVRKIKLDEEVGDLIIPVEFLAKQSESYEAVVFAVGPGKVTVNEGIEIVPMVSVGDSVLVWKHGGTPFNLFGEECAFVTEDEIQCILTLPKDEKVV
ncbi:MAG: co-chaperone GroES family protein [Planctomycetota bacterium]|jgi:co-chaperonin GroES (HSP10)